MNKIRLFMLSILCCFATSLESSLEELEQTLERDLSLIDYYPGPWLPPLHSDKEVYDVVIVGSGMAGMSAGFALQKQGIENIKIFDKNPEGYEGPWMTFARMKNLKSFKGIMGPAFNLPNLTFRAWFESQFGESAWDALGNHIPTMQWMDYLKWYRKILKLPVENNSRIVGIAPQENYFSVVIDHVGTKKEVFARKVVLATGRTGFGGCEIPSFIKDVPKQLYAHTTEEIDFNYLSGKRICIIGCGASAYDTAAEALEHKAKQVVMMMRRACFPSTDHFDALSLPGFYQGFYQLNDEMRFKFIANTSENGIPPPQSALDRVAGYTNLQLKPNTTVECVRPKGQGVEVITNSGADQFDYVILATGFCIDGCEEMALCQFFDQIKLWGDLKFLKDPSKVQYKRLKCFPYLGSHFEFKEKYPGKAPFLKHLYCFNYATVLSHGHVSDDIEGVSIGATRLAEGIAADFFIENCEYFYKPIEDAGTKKNETAD